MNSDRSVCTLYRGMHAHRLKSSKKIKKKTATGNDVYGTVVKDTNFIMTSRKIQS